MTVQAEDVLACVPNLERFARRLNHGGEPVEDIVQETVTRALGALDRYRPTNDLKAWLFTIMKNYVRDQWRKQRNMATVSLTQNAAAETRSAAAPQIDRLMLRELTEAIQRLPPYQRDVLLHISMDPSSYEAASAALGIPVGTVRSRLFRARNSLQRLLDEAAPERRRRGRTAIN
jgi:RNA polymerase sigma-70 factor (ECF subfamily)